MITIRTLREGESFPQHLGTGFEEMHIEPDWAWVAEDGNEIVGVLLAGSCHGLVYLMRLCAQKGCSPSVVRMLLEALRKDCSARGFKAYFFHLDPTAEMDRRLLKVCRKYGGVQLPVPQTMMVGSLETRRTECHRS